MSSVMDGLTIFLLVLLGVGSLSHDWISETMLEVRVQPGDNITLYCDCRTSTGVYTVWYRNCSHENQPPLLLELNLAEMKHTADAKRVLNPLPRFHFVKNESSSSYDLRIVNISDSDEGLYYCGTEEAKLSEDEKIRREKIYRYGNMTTRISFINSSEPQRPKTQDCSVCWMLLFCLCPASAVLSSLLSSVVVYQRCKKTAGESEADRKEPECRQSEDEDECYAALDIRPSSQRPKKNQRQSQSSDACVYSAINTCRS